MTFVYVGKFRLTIANEVLLNNCLGLHKNLNDGDSCVTVASELYEELFVFRNAIVIIY